MSCKEFLKAPWKPKGVTTPIDGTAAPPIQSAAHVPPRAWLVRIMKACQYVETVDKQRKSIIGTSKMSFPAALGPLRVPKCGPAAALSLQEGTWRGPSASRRRPQSEFWRPKIPQGHPIGRQETPASAPERAKRRQKSVQIAFRTEKADLRKSAVFPRKNHTFSCPRAPKSVRNRVQTLFRPIFDDILRRKSLEDSLKRFGLAEGRPKNAPVAPKTPAEPPRRF